MYMNKKVIVGIIIAVLVIVVGGLVVFNKPEEVKEETPAGLTVGTAEEMLSLVDSVYKGIELFNLHTTELDILDPDALLGASGLESTEKIESVIISEPLMSAQAYSLVLVKVKDAADANSIAKEMSEKVNPRKWLCVEAEKICATSSGNVAFLVMSNAEMTDSVYNNFKKIAENVGEEYIIDNQAPDMEMNDMEVMEDMPAAFEG